MVTVSSLEYEADADWFPRSANTRRGVSDDEADGSQDEHDRGGLRGPRCWACPRWRRRAAAKEPPRTPWGDPDLQGIWNNSTTTPLEQMTEAEVQRDRDARAPVIAATRGTGAAWPETGGRLEQPSLIIDPPDGRISMTPEAIARLVAREKAREGRGEAIPGSTATVGSGAFPGRCRSR